MERRSALAPETFAACAAASIVSHKRRGLSANDALLNAAQQLLGLGERQADLFQLVMGLVEDQELLVAGAAVARIDPQPDLDLHILSPHEFSGMRREESPSVVRLSRSMDFALESG